MKILCLFIFLINFSESYVLRKQITGIECYINKPLLVNIDNSFCNLDFNYINPFKFNDCNSIKIEIKNGLKMWYKNNNNIKVDFYTKNKNKKNYIPLDISAKNLFGNIIGKTDRYCNRDKLINTQINLDTKKCFYPDSYLCSIKTFYLILILFAITGIHLFIPIVYDFPKIFFYFTIFIVIFEVILSILIIIQCEKCTPLKGAIAHEFGHVLGFSHPDEDYYFNWIAKYDKKKCIISEKVINRNYDINSIMISKDTNFRFLSYISDNDKLGLYDLYPSCKNIYYEDNTLINQNNVFFLGFLSLLIILPIFFLFIFKIFNKDKQRINIEPDV